MTRSDIAILSMASGATGVAGAGSFKNEKMTGGA